MTTKDKLKSFIPGMRVLKTFLAILICITIDYFRGAQSPFQSSIAAIICLQPTVAGSFETSIHRVFGTIFSGIFTAIVLLSLKSFGMDFTTYSFYFTIALLTFVLMMLLLMIKRTKSISIALVVFLLISFTNVSSEPLTYTLTRVIDTLVGIGVALFINWFPLLNINTPGVVKDEINVSKEFILHPANSVNKINGSKLLRFFKRNKSNEGTKDSK